MIWTLLERLRLLRRCSHCDERFLFWQWSAVRGPDMFYCQKCFDYYARG